MRIGTVTLIVIPTSTLLSADLTVVIVVLSLTTPTALWSILVGLEMEGVMVEITILMTVDLMGGIVTNSTTSIPTAMWRILTGLEIEVVMMVELTILLTADLTVATACD
jgi:hypothetical protein